LQIDPNSQGVALGWHMWPAFSISMTPIFIFLRKIEGNKEQDFRIGAGMKATGSFLPARKKHSPFHESFSN